MTVVAPGTKPVPVIVTVVPPASGPAGGSREATDSGGGSGRSQLTRAR